MSPHSPAAAPLSAASDAGSPPRAHLGSAAGGGASSGNGNATVYASADAARVGGGVYGHLLDAAITLATDPAPSVAAKGNAALRVAGVELAEAALSPGVGRAACFGPSLVLV
jgi:regulator-associated protein of mTOR